MKISNWTTIFLGLSADLFLYSLHNLPAPTSTYADQSGAALEVSLGNKESQNGFLKNTGNHQIRVQGKSENRYEERDHEHTTPRAHNNPSKRGRI